MPSTTRKSGANGQEPCLASIACRTWPPQRNTLLRISAGAGERQAVSCWLACSFATCCKPIEVTLRVTFFHASIRVVKMANVVPVGNMA